MLEPLALKGCLGLLLRSRIGRLSHRDDMSRSEKAIEDESAKAEPALLLASACLLVYTKKLIRNYVSSVLWTLGCIQKART